MSGLVEMSNNQRRMLVETRQLWDAHAHARRRLAGYAGSVGWKTQAGSRYLVRIAPDPDTRVRKMRSLGPASPETEILHDAFVAGKADAKARFETIRVRLDEQARLNRAIGLGRVPRPVARVLRLLDREGLLGRNVFVAGTHSLYAYEAAAGVFVEPDLTATGDLDIVMDARARLRLTLEGEPPRRLIDVLRSVDGSFETLADGSWRAVNRDGFFIDLIKPEPRPPWRDEPDSFGAGDLVAAPIANMRWVMNAPRFETVAVGEDGGPVPFACADPRAFALYKLWMATRDPSRDPVKRRRDRLQSQTVAAIVARYLTHLRFEPEHMRYFPLAAIDMASGGDEPMFPAPSV